MDASVVTLASLVITSITALGLAWIGFKVKLLEHHMNSMREELVLTTAKSSKAEGKLEGRAEVKAEVAAVPPQP